MPGFCRRPTPPLELRNKWYICLQSRAKPEGFVTSSYRTFIRFCPHEKDGRLEEGSVSHGFASRAEVVAYLAGARAQMATRTVDEAFCRGLLAGARVGKPLPMLYYLDASEEPTWRALGYLLQCRRSGFMVILPLEDSVKAQLQAPAEDVRDRAAHLRRAGRGVRDPIGRGRWGR